MCITFSSVHTDVLKVIFVSLLPSTVVMRCAIWYHLHNLKKREKHPI